MNTLDQIETAADALAPPEQEALFLYLSERLGKRREPVRRLPVVPATGRPITQEDIDNALDSD